ncbi:MAG: acetyl-CoA carboxylase, carboxyltransferase subunit beta [Alphaproteobacteria bacterium]|nr:acetyl-CoA carboxylase, carboxyltransferase subunit beta [Alphaproteobacteria bacterium]MBN2779650.1 acetyl-CoA carboxylase, carboxyltransferase subunit beta [Alphaproteobacteria bacterium]
MTKISQKYKDLPKGQWRPCKGCGAVGYIKHIDRNFGICPACGYHNALTPNQWFETLFDDGKFENIAVSVKTDNPLGFVAQKDYDTQLAAARKKTGQDDAAQSAIGRINGIKTVVFAMNFTFIGGSMGRYVGEAFLCGADKAIQEKSAFLAIPASGGARMQESTLSLMQLARTTLGVQKLREAGLPYIVYLTHPTYGGVTASFAMVGDIHLAEPTALIGFAGPRVIEQNIRQKLPKGFQTAEYLAEHGMVDAIVARADLKEKLSNILGILMKAEMK